MFNPTRSLVKFCYLYDFEFNIEGWLLKFNALYISYEFMLI